MNHAAEGVLRCGVYRLGADGLVEASLIDPADEVLLVLRPVGAVGVVTVEVWRGERLRHRWDGTVERPTVLRLRRGTGAGASSRLTCRVLRAGREVFRRTLLQARVEHDAQGRLPADAAPPAASPATLLAYAEELAARLHERPVDPG
jgi:hypothetical protein